MTRRGRPYATLAVALGVLALLGAACGGSRSGRVGIEFVLFGGPVEIAGYEELVDAFEAANPDVDITVSPVAERNDLSARLTTGFAGGSPPDVFLINFRTYGQYASQGVLEPVQPYLAASSVLDEDDFVDPPLDAFRFDGETLTCMPQNVSSLVVHYNVDLFTARGVELPAAGWTWDDFLAAAAALTGEGTYGVGTEPSIIRIAPFVWSNGGNVVDDPAHPSRLTLTEPGPAREALDFFLDLSLEHGVVPPDREEQSEDAQSRFARGGLGMYLDSRKATPDLRSIEDFAWDVAPLPVAPDGEPTTILHSDAFCIAAGTGAEDAAWRFVEFASTARGQSILAASGRTVPSRLDVQADPVFLEPGAPPASAEVFVQNSRIARATPTVASWAAVESAADDILTAVFYGRIDREEGLRRLVAETTPLFGEAGAGG